MGGGHHPHEPHSTIHCCSGGSLGIRRECLLMFLDHLPYSSEGWPRHGDLEVEQLLVTVVPLRHKLALSVPKENRQVLTTIKQCVLCRQIE